LWSPRAVDMVEMVVVVVVVVLVVVVVVMEIVVVVVVVPSMVVVPAELQGWVLALAVEETLTEVVHVSQQHRELQFPLQSVLVCLHVCVVMVALCVLVCLCGDGGFVHPAIGCVHDGVCCA